MGKAIQGLYELKEFYFVCAVLLLLYFIAHFGRTLNQKRARQIVQINRKEFLNHFTNVDQGPTHIENYIYKLYSTGHRGLQFCIMTMRLHRRDNIAYYLANLIFRRKGERITVEAVVKKALPRIVFGVVSQSFRPKLNNKQHFDLLQLCQPTEVQGLSKKFTGYLQKPQDIVWLRKITQDLDYLHVSDMRSFSAFQCAIKAVIQVRQQQHIGAVLKAISELAQHLSQFHQSNSEREAALERRRKIKIPEQ